MYQMREMEIPIIEQQRHYFCSGCGSDFGTSLDNVTIHVLTCQGGSASYYADAVTVITGYTHVSAKTETKTVVDKEGYWKEEVTGYECNKCGATKGK